MTAGGPKGLQRVQELRKEGIGRMKGRKEEKKEGRMNRRIEEARERRMGEKKERLKSND